MILAGSMPLRYRLFCAIANRNIRLTGELSGQQQKCAEANRQPVRFHPDCRWSRAWRLPFNAGEIVFMSAKSLIIALSNQASVATTSHGASRRARALQALCESFPARVDAIKEQRELASIELRRFVKKRESGKTVVRSAASRLNGWEARRGT